MSDHELTRPTYLKNVDYALDGNAAHDIKHEIRQRLYAHDAALRAERDALKAKVFTLENLVEIESNMVEDLTKERDEYKRKYELVLNNAAYGECCEIRAKAEAERDALKEQLLIANTERERLVQANEHWHLRVTQLKEELEATRAIQPS